MDNLLNAILIKRLNEQDKKISDSFKDIKEVVETIVNKHYDSLDVDFSIEKILGEINERYNTTIDSLSQEIAEEFKEAIQELKDSNQDTLDKSINDYITKSEKKISKLKPKDGKDYVITEKDYKKIAKLVEVQVPEYEIPKQPTPDEIRDMLELLQGDDRLDISAIKGFDEILEQIKKADKNIIVGGYRGVQEAPTDSKTYGRNNGEWVEITATGGGAVDSVNGQTGVVELLAENIPTANGLGGSNVEEDLVIIDESIQEINLELESKANNCVADLILADYTFDGTEQNQTGYAVVTTGGNVEITIDPSLFDLTNGLYEFIFCKASDDVNTVTILSGDISGESSYVLSNYNETVTIKIVSATQIKAVATYNKTISVEDVTGLQTELNSKWSKTGNAGTNPAINFIGTTDAQPFIIKTNNTERMRVLSNGNVGINTSNPLARFQVNDTNTFTESTDSFIISTPNNPGGVFNDYKSFKVRSDGSVKLSDRYGDTTNTGLHVNYYYKTLNAFYGRNYSNLASTGLGVSNNKTGTHDFAGSIQSGMTAGTNNYNNNPGAGICSITSYESNNYTAATAAITYGIYAIANTTSNVLINGASKRWIGGYFSSQPTFPTSNANAISIGLKARAVGGQYNYAALFTDGLVGIGTELPTSKLHVTGLPIYADNATALAGGMTAGAFYHNGDGILRVTY